MVEAISGNICRCTGYEPIIDAVLAAASGGVPRLGTAMIELRKDIFADERDDNLNEIGKRTRAPGHARPRHRRSTYFDDHLFDGLLHLSCVRSPHHHARIRRIDTADAERSPGVARIVRGADVPRNLNTLLSLLDFGIDDEPLLASIRSLQGRAGRSPSSPRPHVRRRGRAEGPRRLRAVPAVLDVEDAISPAHPCQRGLSDEHLHSITTSTITRKLRFGDVERAFAGADHVLEQRYQMSPIEHAPTETNGSIAAPDTNGRYVVYTSTQALFFSLDTCAKILRPALEPLSLHRRNRRRRLRRQGRHPDRAARRSSARC